jgi:hypothetical protein
MLLLQMSAELSSVCAFAGFETEAYLPGVAHWALFSGPLSRAAVLPRLRRDFRTGHVRRWGCDCIELHWHDHFGESVEKMGAVVHPGKFQDYCIVRCRSNITESLFQPSHPPVGLGLGASMCSSDVALDRVIDHLTIVKQHLGFARMSLLRSAYGVWSVLLFARSSAVVGLALPDC